MEINKEDLDRIVISSNDQMQKIIDWFFDHLEYIKKITQDNGGAPFPLNMGSILFAGESIEIVFRSKPRRTDIDVYAKTDNGEEFIKIFSFWFDPHEEKDETVDISSSVQDLKVYTNDAKRKKMILELIDMDSTPKKIITKFLCVMMFMLFNEEIVEVDRSQDKPRTKREIRRLKSRGGPISLVRKTYVLKNFDPKKLKISGQPRRWTAPDHEVAVRGHYRHLQSGKVIWISEFSKFKEKGNRQPKTWKL